MKKLLLIPLLFIAGISFSEELNIQDLSSGMYSFQSPNKIPDNSASMIQNFYTDIQPLGVERNGYVTESTVTLGSPSANTGNWQFVDVSGTEWLITFSSQSYYKRTYGTLPVKFGSNPTSAVIPDAAVNLGKIVFTNGTDPVWYFDGTSTGTIASAPKGTLIEPWRTRFIIGNVPATQSTLYFSADGDATNWTLGGLSTDPFTLQIGGANDGQYIRCLQGAYLDNIIVGRKYNLWAISGFDQTDVQTRNISYEVGCIEPRTMKEREGSLYFLSARGMEAMTGSSITPISEPIRDITDVLIRNSANQRTNTQTTQVDWAAGTNDNSIYIDTQTSPGGVQLTFPDLFDSYRDGTAGSKAVWISSRSSSVTGSTVSVVSGNLNIKMDVGSLHAAYAQTSTYLTDFQQGTSYYITVSSLPFYAGSFERFFIVLSSRNYSATFPTSDPMQNTSNFYVQWTSTSDNTATIQSVTDDRGDATLTVSTTATIPFTFTLWMATTTFTYSVNNVLVKSGSHTWPHNNVFVALAYEHGNGGVPGNLKLDNFGVSPQTGTYTSQLLNIGSSISSWGPVTISDLKTGGNITYQFGSTGTANLASIVNFASISNGAVPSVSTNSFAAFKAAFSNTAATAPVLLSEFVTSWNEGGIAPSPVGFVYDRRYWLSLTTATATSPFLDTVFVFQRNNTWTMLKGINAASFALLRDKLYFGNSNGNGLNYLFDVGNNDNGASIFSQIMFKSQDGGSAFRDKDFRRSYLTFLGNSQYTGSFTLGYNVDQGTTTYSLGSVNMNDSTGQTWEKFPFMMDGTLPLQGREIQFVLQKSGTGDRLKLFNIALDYALKEVR